MEKQYDVVALGELLVDFTTVKSQGKRPVFQANPGGAPCNVLAMLATLGKKTAFIGKVGSDYFGAMLHHALEDLGISTEGLIHDASYNTTLAFVHNDEQGEREFSFYRKPGADQMLRSKEVSLELIEKARIFHFGSLSMTDEPSLEATRKAIEHAQKSKVLLSFDPNLRPALWENLGTAKDRIREGFSACEVLKISKEELAFITGMGDLDRAARFVMDHYQIPLLFVTCGKQGSTAYFPGGIVHQETFLQVPTIDTTGAGDTFYGCMLNFLLEWDGNPVSQEEMGQALRFANAAASLITTRKGAMEVMPAQEEIEELLAQAEG